VSELGVWLMAAVTLDVNVGQIFTALATSFLAALTAIGWRILKYIPRIQPYHEQAMAGIAEVKREVVTVGSRVEAVANHQIAHQDDMKKKIGEMDARLETVERHITQAP
jgi:hypothetical protein